MATRLSSAPQSQPPSYRPTQYGALDLPGSGPKPVPAPQATRHQPAVPSVPRSGSREVANVSGSGLVEAGKQTTGGQQVQQVAPVLNNANSE